MPGYPFFMEAAPGHRSPQAPMDIARRTQADGSLGALHYWANGAKSFPKERIEVFSEGRTAVIDNWRTTTSYDWPSGPRLRTRQDKGHRDEIAQFLQRIERGGAALIPFTDLALVTAASFAAVQSAKTGERIVLDSE